MITLLVIYIWGFAGCYAFLQADEIDQWYDLGPKLIACTLWPVLFFGLVLSIMHLTERKLKK